jgi:MGT family glycosyltransferase
VHAHQSIVVMSPGGSHVQRLLPLVAGLAKRRLTVHVMTRGEARGQVEQAGGVFFDLYAKYPPEAVDRDSIPVPTRLVSFAAAYAEPLIADVSALRPGLLVYDSFVVAAPLIARRLGIPYVGMRAGHAQVPARAIAEMHTDPRVAISDRCRAAVETLRREYGMPEASPFSYLDGVSPYLNLYAEPPRFLDDDDRAAFEPLAFFGGLAPELREARSHAHAPRGGGRRPRVYVSFGSVVWWYFAEAACAAMARLADVLSGSDAEAVISLGHHPLSDADLRRIARPHVRVESYVDQWGLLKETDLFVTHHGLNSTHEAIFHQVPMLSCPFFGDQPAMARRCQDLGLAVPLADPRTPLTVGAIRRALDEVAANRQAMGARLAEARVWELRVIEGREAVLDRILGLSGTRA